MSSAFKNMDALMSGNLFSNLGELRRRIVFVILVMIIYRIGTYVPLPGINSIALSQLASQQSGGILGIFNTFTGGALGRMSIFALNIMPYITASIIMQLMTVISSDVANMKKEGEVGRKKINQMTRYLTVLLALLQGYGIASGIQTLSAGGQNIVVIPGLFFKISATLSLTGGTVFVMWLSEQINQRGIGNGSSLIIFAGIVSGLPSAIATFVEMGRTGAISTGLIIGVLAIVLGLFYLIIFVEKGQRRIKVNYPKRQRGNKIFGGESTHLPLKLNTAGVIPPIFASSLLLFPSTFTSFMQGSDSEIVRFIALNLSRGKILYTLLFILFIVFFSFFYTSIIFNPEETADNLKKNGGVVIGRRPGKDTQDYFDYILTRLTVLGAIYMSFICVLPEIVMAKYSVPFALGGTSLLIVVNVVMDLITQFQTHMLSHQYHNVLKKAGRARR
jgi:preprotein translocase subunit SecY